MHDDFIPEDFDVITEDFDVEVFFDLLHWSWEDAQKDTHEHERPVSPFSQPTPRNSEPVNARNGHGYAVTFSCSCNLYRCSSPS
ncbi:uncharacterized protein FFB14_07261 [Fusarium fujikuroi]|nr:uncharacterized protein FFB14_07261 [Fusarium fujikuroi]